MNKRQKKKHERMMEIFDDAFGLENADSWKKYKYWSRSYQAYVQYMKFNPCKPRIEKNIF